MSSIEELEEKLGIQFKDKSLIERVFIHRSYLNEHKSLKLEHNERLEFLGDAVLELAVTRFLYNNYHKPEGEMTNWRSALVKGESLSFEAKRLNGSPMKLTRRQNVGKARSNSCQCFEALIGAIYLDQGFDKASDFIVKTSVIKSKIIKHELYYDAKVVPEAQEKVITIYDCR